MMSSSLGIADWATLFPSSNGTLFLGPSFRPYTPALFHHLHCLDVMRGALAEEYVRAEKGLPPKDRQEAETEHCANYVRQSVLCASDLTVENVKATSGLSVTDTDGTHVCRDWSAVYDAAEENWKEYQAHLAKTQ
jgi:hypothetical protein